MSCLPKESDYLNYDIFIHVVFPNFYLIGILFLEVMNSTEINQGKYRNRRLAILIEKPFILRRTSKLSISCSCYSLMTCQNCLGHELSDIECHVWIKITYHENTKISFN